MSIGARVLVTGAGGALGGHAAQLLAVSGREVYGTYRPGLHAGVDQPNGVRWLSCDLRNSEEVRAVVMASRPSLVMHAVGLTGTGDVRALVEANVIALANLVEALAEAPVERVLVIGSSAEYAVTSGREPIREDHVLGPSSHYGLSKLFQFELSQQAFRAGMPVVYARPFNFVGPRVSGATAVGDLSRRVAQIVRERGPGVLEVGDLDKWRDYIDVRDAAAACVMLLQQAQSGGVYNVCSGVPVLLADVVDRLVAIAGKPIRLHRVQGEPSVTFQTGDASRMRALGWSPTYALETSLRDGLQAQLGAMEGAR